MDTWTISEYQDELRREIERDQRHLRNAKATAIAAIEEERLADAADALNHARRHETELQVRRQSAALLAVLAQDLAKGADNTSPSEQPPVDTRTVTTPACRGHGGLHSMTAQLEWRCLTCGGPRGEPYKGQSFDGSARMTVDRWDNPCGHVESYADVRAHIQAAAARLAG